MLAVRRPDWLHEARGPDVLPAMRWYPFVTFWQVTADLGLAQDTRLGHGHRYGGELASAWAAIAPPPGWTSADTARLDLRRYRPPRQAHRDPGLRPILVW
jgi:uncharacterized membrane protein